MTMLNFKKASVIKNLVGKTEIVMWRHTQKMMKWEKNKNRKHTLRKKDNVNEKERDRDTMKDRLNAKWGERLRTEMEGFLRNQIPRKIFYILFNFVW